MEGQEKTSKPNTKKPPRKHRQNPILRLREFYSLSRVELASFLNISPWTLKEWENDVRSPRPEGWRRLRSIFVELAIKNGHSREKAVAFIDTRLYPAKD